MKTILTVLILTALAFGQSTPNLRTTTTWMQDFASTHSIWANDDGSMAFEHLQIDGCRVFATIWMTKDGKVIPPKENDAAFSFSLGDLDPQTVRTVVPNDHNVRAYVEFETTDSKRLIQLSSQKGAPVGVGMASWEINLDNKENADRFTNAFKHAVTLCGGKPSTF
jgi:hypothetical protein